MSDEAAQRVPPENATTRLTTRSLVLAAVAVLSVVAFVGLVWTLRSVLLLVFGSAIFAVLFRALAGWIEDRTPLGPRGSLAVSMLLVVLIILGGVALFGAQVSAQVANLFQQIPDAWENIRQRLSEGPVFNAVRDQLESVAANTGQTIMGQITTVLTVTIASVVNVVLVFFGAVYLASKPKTYREGLIRLFPQDARRHARKVMDEIAKALRTWLVGQVLAMVIVGVLTGGVLTLLGVPSALALGLFAGLAEFVPIVGPIAAAVPALLLAFSVSGELFIYAAVAVLVIQQVESNLITPLIQRRMLEIPPAITLFAIVAFGLVFGPLGIIFAAPLTVVAFVLVRRLYVADFLGDDL